MKLITSILTLWLTFTTIACFAETLGMREKDFVLASALTHNKYSSIQSNGDLVVINKLSGASSVYVYQKGNLIQKLQTTATNVKKESDFGEAISLLGQSLVATDAEEHSIYIYDFDGNQFNLQTKIQQHETPLKLVHQSDKFIVVDNTFVFKKENQNIVRWGSLKLRPGDTIHNSTLLPNGTFYLQLKENKELIKLDLNQFNGRDLPPITSLGTVDQLTENISLSLNIKACLPRLHNDGKHLILEMNDFGFDFHESFNRNYSEQKLLSQTYVGFFKDHNHQLVEMKKIVVDGLENSSQRLSFVIKGISEDGFYVIRPTNFTLYAYYGNGYSYENFAADPLFQMNLNQLVRKKEQQVDSIYNELGSLLNLADTTTGLRVKSIPRPEYKNSRSGFIEIFQDGKIVQTIKGRTTWNGEDGFGSAVNIYQDQIVATAPQDNRIYWFKKVKDKFEVYASVKDTHFDTSKDDWRRHIFQNDNFIVVTKIRNPIAFEYENVYYVYRKEQNKIVFQEEIVSPVASVLRWILECPNAVLLGNNHFYFLDKNQLVKVNLKDSKNSRTTQPIDKLFSAVKLNNQGDVEHRLWPYQGGFLIDTSVANNKNIAEQMINVYTEDQGQLLYQNSLSLNHHHANLPFLKFLIDTNQGQLKVDLDWQNNNGYSSLPLSVTTQEFEFFKKLSKAKGLWSLDFSEKNKFNFPDANIFYYKHLKKFYTALIQSKETDLTIYQANLALRLMQGMSSAMIQNAIPAFDHKVSRLFNAQDLKRPLTDKARKYLKEILITALNQAAAQSKSKSEIAAIVDELKNSSQEQDISIFEAHESSIHELLLSEYTKPLAMVILEIQKQFSMK